MGPRGPQTAVIGGNRSMVFTVNAGGGMHGMQFGPALGGALGGGCVNHSLRAACTRVSSLLLQTGIAKARMLFCWVAPRLMYSKNIVCTRWSPDP